MWGGYLNQEERIVEQAKMNITVSRRSTVYCSRVDTPIVGYIFTASDTYNVRMHHNIKFEVDSFHAKQRGMQKSILRFSSVA